MNEMDTLSQHSTFINQRDSSVGFAEPRVDPLLQYSIREQLKALTTEKLTDCQRRANLCESMTLAVTTLLQQETADHSVLTKIFQAMYENVLQSMAKAEISQQSLTHEYLSPTGYVMSPLHCRTTIKDIYRLHGFIRGLDRAIKDRLKSDAVVRILYPACGPFAPLVLPLIQYYQSNDLVTEQQVQITLVDVQPGAIQAVKQLVSDLSIQGFIDDIVEADATLYHPEQTFDLLVLEAMQHGFTKEGQLSIAKHLIQFLSVDGVLIPQQISVHGMMVRGEIEFNQQWQDSAFSHSINLRKKAVKDRVELGEIFQINRSSLLALEEVTLPSQVKMVKANRISLPVGIEDMKDRILAVYATLNVYSDESISEYDSGITHPRPDMTFYVDTPPRSAQPEHFLAFSGDDIQFYYQLTGLPGFVALKADSEA
ncbi:conserved hypothetical protein [Vibrio coralliirubri]|uniref:hypothetical protein n=1 Tax=Vibrio coralliirubri TaxID=1516159 RepID=UPI0006374358|nr:hypothetical protein [Vibrio coralliirubri]CDT99656.1 conserved hypothetical protein [Vibrio coralliirubri]